MKIRSFAVVFKTRVTKTHLRPILSRVHVLELLWRLRFHVVLVKIFLVQPLCDRQDNFCLFHWRRHIWWNNVCRVHETWRNRWKHRDGLQEKTEEDPLAKPSRISLPGLLPDLQVTVQHLSLVFPSPCALGFLDLQDPVSATHALNDELPVSRALAVVVASSSFSPYATRTAPSTSTTWSGRRVLSVVAIVSMTSHERRMKPNMEAFKQEEPWHATVRRQTKFWVTWRSEAENQARGGDQSLGSLTLKL